jgi:hypothetical protein
VAGAAVVALLGSLLTATGADAAGPCSRTAYGNECELNFPGGWVHGGARYAAPHPGTVEGQVLAGDVWLDRTTSPASGRWTGPVIRHAGVTPYIAAGSYYWRACTRQARYYCTVWFK